MRSLCTCALAQTRPAMPVDVYLPRARTSHAMPADVRVDQDIQVQSFRDASARWASDLDVAEEICARLPQDKQ